MSTSLPDPPRPRHRSGLRALLAAAVGAALVGTVTGVLAVAAPSVSSGRTSGQVAQAAELPPAPSPVPRPVLGVTGAGPGGVVPWQRPLQLAASGGTLRTVAAVDPDGALLPGTVDASGRWTSARTLVPAATYRVTATVEDAAGAPVPLPLVVRTSPAEDIVKARLSPGDDAVVGVGQPVVVTLDRDVASPAARNALAARLRVTTRPSVPGAWRWLDDRTLHYRPAEFWRPGTRVDVRADLTRLSLPGGTWGSGVRTTRFTVDDALVSTVDVAAKTMTVRRDGRVLRVMKASMGKPEFATRNGVFLVLEKHRRRVMDSATVDLPPGTPAYRTAVEHAVRLTYSGTFTHGAPWSVPDQGVRNVSHGCINLSPADAAWFYDQARRGDVVRVVGSSRGPLLSDPGSADWNMSFAQWRAPAG